MKVKSKLEATLVLELASSTDPRGLQPRGAQHQLLGGLEAHIDLDLLQSVAEEALAIYMM